MTTRQGNQSTTTDFADLLIGDIGTDERWVITFPDPRTSTAVVAWFRPEFHRKMKGRNVTAFRCLGRTTTGHSISFDLVLSEKGMGVHGLRYGE
jgi:hypothetical protein